MNTRHRSLVVLVTGTILAAHDASAQAPGLPVRDIAFARDGRLAASIEGDIWVRQSNGRSWVQVTRGAAWDRQPAWATDGAYLVFVSDREGQDDLYRVAPAREAAVQRVTTSPLPDLEPAVARDGTIFFVRERGNDARLWQRSASGEEKRLTSGTTQERSPVLSPAGDRLAYIQHFDGGRRVRVRVVGGSADSIVTAERSADDIAWSPGGDRIALTTGTPRPALYVTPADGRYVNFVASARGDVAWSPDGATILVAQRTPDEAGYNGDPDRVGDRRASEALRGDDRLLTIPAPVAPAGTPTAVVVDVRGDRASRNRDAFARFATRMERTYFAAPEAANRARAWRAVIDRLAPRAAAAVSDSALEETMQQAIAERPELREPATGRAAVSSAHPVATAAGVEILAKGGNVVDAAVAVSFALGVVEPDASGVGGYGEMLVQLKGMAKPALLEFMARVPEEAGLSNATLMTDGRYPSDGPMLAMVPGTVAAMHTAWKRHGSGKVPWADLVAPAIRAARDGYVVSDGLATTLRLERERFAKYESSRALFFRNGKPLQAGDTLRNADLAWTLDQIAKAGADGFYRGEVARRLVNDLRGKGNAIRLTDLARYFAADREPVATTYRGYTVYGSAPPVSGGATLAAQLNHLEQVATLRPYTSDAATLHAMITAWQLVPTSRNRIADPSLWPTDISPFTSKDTARTRWRCFDPAHALAPSVFRGDTLTCAGPAATPQGNAHEDIGPADLAEVSTTEPCNLQDHARAAECRAQGTTSFTVADADGNAVAVTQTLGTWGGNFYVTPGLGFLYNDKLTSYGTDPNAYGARLPYARHGSTISPTIVLRGDGDQRRAVLTLGAAGNAWINAAVYQTLVGVLDLGLSPQRALELPRFLPSQRGAFGGGATREFMIDIEDGIAPAVTAQLRAMGHRFNVISLKGELRMGYGAAISIGRDAVTAGADPRRSGAAGAVP
ncbi:MAG: gamma-glutamyltransferase [Gemmatimonadaceae bacterium]|nr:gamma-glutamyltransferase [Gemmatimonadaceae bacterium]